MCFTNTIPYNIGAIVKHREIKQNKNAIKTRISENMQQHLTIWTDILKYYPNACLCMCVFNSFLK